MTLTCSTTAMVTTAQCSMGFNGSFISTHQLPSLHCIAQPPTPTPVWALSLTIVTCYSTVHQRSPNMVWGVVGMQCFYLIRAIQNSSQMATLADKWYVIRCLDAWRPTYYRTGLGHLPLSQLEWQTTSWREIGNVTDKFHPCISLHG